MWWLLIPGAIAAFIAVLVIRAAAFRPVNEDAAEKTEVAADAERAAESLSEMLRCKTVSYYPEDLKSEEEFERFRSLLKTRYPLVNRVCGCERIGESGVLYTLKGKSSEKPAVFMAHYDVVPADEEKWEKPAFQGIIENGVIWGRGALDTKSTLCGVMEAAETLLEKGFTPENDLYFAFSGDEEIYGRSASAIVDEFKKRGVTPAFVLDEGGAIIENAFPGVKRKCALVGIAEKGVLNAEFSAESAGGHSSAPPAHSPVGVLSKAVCAVENKPFKYKLTKPVREMFDILGRHSGFAYRLIFANLWCFMPVLNSMAKKKGGELNAMLRTTCAFTMAEASKAPNVLPPVAKVGANLRLLNHTQDEAIAYLNSVVADENVKIKNRYGMDPSAISKTEGEAWDKLKSAIAESWPEALVSPYVMLACSDSRHYCRISDAVYRFSAMELTGEERAMIHGNNERIPVEKLAETVKFYIRLMRKL